jgi:hypothetical protein
MKARLGLRTIVWIGSSVLTLGPVLVAGWVYIHALQRETEAMLADSLQTRGHLGAEQVARRLYQLWQTVDRFSKSITPDQWGGLQHEFTRLIELDDRASWLGLADLNGRVVAASKGMLEGQDVSQRPWFRNGMAGPFAGDVHEAVLLAKLLARADEPIRFVDFAAPVRTGSATTGVLGLHVNWSWISDQLASLGGRGTDLILLSGDRRVLFGPADLLDKQLNIASAFAGRRAGSVVRPERWPDGRTYMTAVIPAVQHRDLPNFGWSIVVRTDLDAALAPTRDLTRAFWAILSGGAIVSVVLLYLGAAWLATPLQRLIGFGKRLAGNEPNAIPYAETRYREAADLNFVLVRLQSRIRSLAPPAAADAAAGLRKAG